MELKVVCDCGQKYKFDVVPENGRMPYTVNCPICGVDGTPAANQLLGQQIAAASAPPPLPSLEPAPAAGGLRINRPAPTAAAPPLFSASASTPPLRPGSAPAPIRPVVKAPIAASKDFSMGLGILGAALGSAVGGALVYGFFLFAQFRFPLSGTAIGVLAGYGARMLARGTDTTLGFIAGGFALAAVVGVFYLMYGGFFIFGLISIVICVSFAYRIASG